MGEVEVWIDYYNIRCFGWEVVLYRGVVWKVMRGFWN